jgi:phosphoribosylformimino-5-aminoimidazole carboxamide ribotide isomerase
MDTVRAYFDLGLQFVILGTVAHKDPDFVHRACEEFPGRILIGIDARGDQVAVEGWTQDTSWSPIDLVRRFEDSGVGAVIYTDIWKDGMRSGPNIEATGSLGRAIRIPVIASGGISDISDVRRVAGLTGDGVIGMITGRALYDGSLRLTDAIRVAANA